MTDFEKEKDIIESTIEGKNLSYNDIQYFVKDGRRGFSEYGAYENNILYVSHGVDYACLSGSVNRENLLTRIDDFFEGKYGFSFNSNIEIGKEIGIYPTEYGNTPETGALIIERVGDNVKVFFDFEREA